MIDISVDFLTLLVYTLCMIILTSSVLEVSDKIFELQLFVNDRLKDGRLPEINMGQTLIDDIQIIRHIWTRDKGTI